MLESENLNINSNSESSEAVAVSLSDALLSEMVDGGGIKNTIDGMREDNENTVIEAELVIANQSEGVLSIGIQEANIINNIDKQEIKHHNIFQLFSFDEFINYIKRYGIITLTISIITGIAYYFGMQHFRYYQNTVSVLNAVTAFKEENPDFKIWESSAPVSNDTSGAVVRNVKKNVSSINRTINMKKFEIKVMNGLYSVKDGTRLTLNKISISFTDVKTNKQLCLKNSIIANQELTPDLGLGGWPDGDIIKITTETLTQIKNSTNILSTPVPITTPGLLYVTVPFDLTDGANVDVNYTVSYELTNLDNHEMVTSSSSGKLLTSMTNVDFNDLRNHKDYDFYHLLDFTYPSDTLSYANRWLSIHLGKNEKIVKYIGDGESEDDKEKEDAIQKDTTLNRIFGEPLLLTLYKAILLHDKSNEKYYLLRKIKVESDGTVETVNMSASQSGCISGKWELFEQNEVSKFEFESIVKVLYPSYWFDPVNISSVYFLPGSQSYKLVLRDNTKTERVVKLDTTDEQMSFYDFAKFVSYDQNRNTVTWTAEGADKITIETNIDNGVTRTIQKVSIPENANTSTPQIQTSLPHQYTVKAEKTYFYDTLTSAPRKWYLIKWETVTIEDSKISGGFGYVEYNSNGKKTVGYLLISTLLKK